MRKVLIIGASGFIGTELRKGLKGFSIDTYRGHEVAEKPSDKIAEDLEGKDVIINLAGASLFSIWTRSRKRKIRESRINTTSKLVEAILKMDNPPEHFINASAVGIYRTETPSDEYSDDLNDNFLARVVKEWENCLQPLENSKTKFSILRFGIVMGRRGGAYKILRTLTKFNAGAYFDKGLQSLSFIYIADLVRAVEFIIDKGIYGVVNIVNPETANYKSLLQNMKKELNSLIIWSVPGSLIKVFLGDVSEMLLEGQIVKPSVLLKNNFNFEVSDINSCVNKLENN